MQYESRQNPEPQHSNDPVGCEQRHSARQAISVHGGLLLNDKHYYVEMVDLSKSGARLVLEPGSRVPEVGESAMLYLVWPFEIDSGLLSVEITIVRVDGNEIAIHFNHVPI